MRFSASTDERPRQRPRSENDKIASRNFESNPKADLEATDLHVVVSNLTNMRDKNGRRVADLTATANVLGDAALDTQADFDPFSHFQSFDFRLRVRNIQLTHLNIFMCAYALLDFASGQGDFVMQPKARNGMLNGYAKPLLYHMVIFSWMQDADKKHENPFEIARLALAAVVAWRLEIHSKTQFATRVPITGRIDDKNIGTFDAIFGVLRNAFIKAYQSHFAHLKPPPVRGNAEGKTEG